MKCDKCGKELSKDEIALNKKLISRNAVEFLCIECLAQYIGTTVEEMEDKIEQFKEEGCGLFI